MIRIKYVKGRLVLDLAKERLVSGGLKHVETHLRTGDFVDTVSEFQNNDLAKKWKNLYKIKQEANVAIEEKRSAKEIGSSLEAEIEIYTSDENFKLLEKIDLSEYFITSKVKLAKNTVNKKETTIKVKKINGEKCPRCWKIFETNCIRCAEFL